MQRVNDKRYIVHTNIGHVHEVFAPGVKVSGEGKALKMFANKPYVSLRFKILHFEFN